MRKRRNANRGLTVRAARAAGSVGVLLWSKAVRRPVDSAAIFAAVAASAIIVVNAVFLQSGTLSAPYFTDPLPLTSPAPAVATGSPTAPQLPAAPSRDDPIAQLIGLSSRIMAVQKVLSDYGYGQITPTGVVDQPTAAAIEKFERGHGLPVTGRLSDRLVGALAVMTGRPLE